MTNPLQFVLNGIQLTTNSFLSLRGDLVDETSNDQGQHLQLQCESDAKSCNDNSKVTVEENVKSAVIKRQLRSNNANIDVSQFFHYDKHVSIPDYSTRMVLVENDDIEKEDEIKAISVSDVVPNSVEETKLHFLEQEHECQTNNLVGLSKAKNLDQSLNSSGTATSKVDANKTVETESNKNLLISLYNSSLEDPSRPKPTQDPLLDELYLPRHRRMERQEKRIQMIEKEKAAVELDRFMHQKNSLTGPNWKKDILSITVINDPNDDNELKLKRDLTLADINLYLVKYKSWKTRQKEVREKVQSDLPMNEQLSEMDQQAKKRKLNVLPSANSRGAKTKSSCQAVVTLHAADLPHNSKPTKPMVSFFHESIRHTRPKFDQLLRRDHRNIRAFGQKIPKLSLTEFEFPHHWRKLKRKRFDKMSDNI